MNKAPFYDGQKIIRTGPTVMFTHGTVTNGQRYTSAGCLQCKCGRWYVFIKEFPCPNVTRISICGCGHNSGQEDYFSALAHNFAPIPPRDVSIDEAIIEQAEEMIGVKETAAPVKVLVD